MPRPSACFSLMVFLIPLLAGCAGSSGGVSRPATAPDLPAIDTRYAPAEFPGKITTTSVPMILDPSRVPPEPDAAINNATLAGVDSNNNGIRDDVERWIASEFSTPQERAVVAQMAKSMQATAYWKAGASSLEYIESLTDASMVCAIYASQDGTNDNPAAKSKRFNKIMAKTFNTTARVKLLWIHSAEFAGKVVPHYSERGVNEKNACELILGGQ